MTNFRRHIISYYSAILLFIGLVCLNLHSLTHLNDQAPVSHQTKSESVPLNKISDDCVLCLVSAFGFADLQAQQFSTVRTEAEIILFPDFSSLTYQTNSVIIPRAPPAS